MNKDEQGVVNTDTTIYRDEDQFISLFMTEDGRLGINVGGNVHVRPIREWHRLAREEAHNERMMEIAQIGKLVKEGKVETCADVEKNLRASISPTRLILD